MILLKLKNYIKRHERVSLHDIQYHFDIDETASIGLLEPLLQQGYVQEIANNSSCNTGGCSTHCHQISKGSLFQWIDKPIKPIAIPVHIV